MKMSTAANKLNSNFELPPPIPLRRPTLPEPTKLETLIIKLRSDPTDANSQTYDLPVRIFKTGTPEEWLLFVKDLRRVIAGQNITTGPNKYSMTRRLLGGDAEAVFLAATTAHGNETNANFELCLRDVATHIFPQRALLRQKRYMRTAMRKPVDMTTRVYAARINEINSYLSDFPPFEDNQQLAVDEINLILEFGVPKSWQKNMVLQGFEPMIHTPNEIVEFCERHEFTEGQSGRNNTGTSSKPASKQSKGAIWRAKSSAEASTSSKRKHTSVEKYCDLHQTSGHSTAECKVVQAQIQRMRGSWDSVKKSPAARANYKNNNNTHVGGNGKAKLPFKHQKEVMALVKEGVREALGAKKRKKEDDQAELDNFNIEDFDNLVLSEDEQSDSADAEAEE